ncbi:hypothetical protein SPSYN_02109 [Sporotomaculum syntrophicum]|uniref:Uncharacterized protein n=1 Tax=Sporotomaculum syntrophicum TaxID=182264 RepID=A0A9D2WNU4_9FIRM|nr:hypothetical protein [Sporotomaculum syntrophicum]KAF1084333.1 hypothetical protein SPSYN_02109 [Sporotomaculum syntrophicum]
MSKQIDHVCDLCHKAVVQVHLQIYKGNTLHICLECNNNLTAELMGLELMPFQPGIYEFSGIRGKKYNFSIHRKINPIGIVYEANEVTKGDSPGFQIAVMDYVNCDQQLLFEKLKAKIKKAIFKRYLETSTAPYGSKVVSIKNREVVGRFEYDEDHDLPKLVIDGKLFSWEEFGRMLNSSEGFQFQLKIFDITDDII